MKTILITGATDGIGLQTAKKLSLLGHKLLLHGRSADKLESAKQVIAEHGKVEPEVFMADFSNLAEVAKLSQEVLQQFQQIDVVINNAGVLNSAEPITASGIDVRFVVNTLAPYLLTRKLLPSLTNDSRVVNLSSAAQSAVDPDALVGNRTLDDMSAYSQSKLALNIWSMELAGELGADGPKVIAVNPGSLLASKMVKEGFGVPGKDLSIGANILVKAALEDSFSDSSGKYFDNDSGQFANPHSYALDKVNRADITRIIHSLVQEYL